MILELGLGGDLFDFVQKHHERRLSVSLARELTRQIARALAHCHAQGIVHRDVKLENFVFSNHTGLRVPLFNEISMYDRVDAAGSLLNNMGQRIPGRGDQKPKVDFISEYRFTIAAENSSFPGYTTEKLLHPLSIGSIPIYWGSPVAHLDFNQDAYINVHEFDDLVEVVDLIEDPVLHHQHPSVPSVLRLR